MDFEEEVLITGGCGSIGSAVVRYLLEGERSPSITVFDNDEQAVFAFERELREEAPEVSFEFGNVRDQERLAATMASADYVIHTAGLKQVPHCESHPYEAIRTNVDGTWNVVQAARRTGVDSVLTLSTDKAVAPSSTMGASKMLAERLTHAAHARAGPEELRLGCVRLGNVVDSAGSVVPLFREQIRSGGPVTVTDPAMTRFAMSKRRAASFVVDCVTEQAGGRVHAPKIGRFRLADLADAMIEEYAPSGTSPAEIEIETIGRRPGERSHEYLVGPTEIDRTFEHDRRYSIRPPQATGESADASAPAADLPADGYRSDTEPFMDAAEILDLVEDCARASKTPSASGDDSLAIAGTDDAD